MIYISNSAWAAEAWTPYANINNPLVFFRSFLRPENIFAATVNPSRPPINMWNPDTASVWQGESAAGTPSASSTQYITLVNPTNIAASYVGIAGHNLGDQMWKVSVERSIDLGSTWSAITSEQTIINNDPIVFFFDYQQPSAMFRIKLSLGIVGAPAVINPPMIAHVKLGFPLALYRRIFSGFEPSLMKKSKTIQNGSENGQYLGQVVIRSYREISDIKQEHQPASYVRQEIVPFLKHCNGEPAYANTAPRTFFMAWRPQKYPSELIYGWATDIEYPVNETGNSQGGYMSWGISVGATA